MPEETIQEWKTEFPDVMTEEDLIKYLRIDEISHAKKPSNVVNHFVEQLFVEAFRTGRKIVLTRLVRMVL
jgi:hypothetical protein